MTMVVITGVGLGDDKVVVIRVVMGACVTNGDGILGGDY